MQDDCNWRIFGTLRVVAAFEAAFWAGKNHFGH
jgi:hypothetical protein